MNTFGITLNQSESDYTINLIMFKYFRHLLGYEGQGIAMEKAIFAYGKTLIFFDTAEFCGEVGKLTPNNLYSNE